MADDDPTRRADPGDSPTVRGLKAGQIVFGRYVLETELGAGGMGVVWRARDVELDEPVALKFLPEVVARDDAAVAELKDETRHARRLTHPNIVRIHHFEREGAMAAVSMEFVDGTTLSHLRLQQPGKVFAVETLAPLVAQLCAALDYAHGQAKIVHRDLKPANILVTRDDVVKVTDFGIARSLSDTHTRLTGRAENTSGTLLYMSPQQLRGDDPAASDDIYALGATLYELLTGKPPFHTGDVAWQIRGAAPMPLNQRLATLGLEPAPTEWEETILACLVKEPENRPQSAGKVAARLATVGSRAVPERFRGADCHSDELQPPLPGHTEDKRGLTARAPYALPPLGTKRRSRFLFVAGLAVLALGVLSYAFWPKTGAVPQTSSHFDPSTVRPVTAFDETKAKAEGGYDWAQVSLGSMYENGDGVPKDSAEVVKWYRKAADQGNASAQYDLGEMYASGDGVPKDGAEAVKWYRKAADQGYHWAQVRLGTMYANGDGVPKDSAEAVKWYRKAAEQGYAEAQDTLGLMYAKGYGVPKDSAEAVKWYRKAADQGNVWAQDALGTMYANGDGVAKDSVEAVWWYRKAADQGYALAQHNLGVVYENGDGVPKDETEALAWYEIAAASGIDTIVKDRDALELRLGRETTLLAQQRGKEILKKIETAKTRSAGSAADASSSSKSSGSGMIVSARGPNDGQARTVPVAQQTLLLTATGPVEVWVNEETRDGPSLWRGQMGANDSHSLPKKGKLYLTATAMENLQIEIGSRRAPNPYSGRLTVEIP